MNLNLAVAHIRIMAFIRKTAPAKVAFKAMPPLQPENLVAKKDFFFS